MSLVVTGDSGFAAMIAADNELSLESVWSSPNSGVSLRSFAAQIQSLATQMGSPDTLGIPRHERIPQFQLAHLRPSTQITCAMLSRALTSLSYYRLQIQSAATSLGSPDTIRVRDMSGLTYYGGD